MRGASPKGAEQRRPLPFYSLKVELLFQFDHSHPIKGFFERKWKA